MFCGNCGKQIEDNQNFCPYCGHRTTKPVYNCSNSTNTGDPQCNNYGYQSHGSQDDVKNYNLVTAYVEMFKKYAQFSGRSRRSEYWLAVLANCIIIMIAYTVLFIPLICDIVSNGEPSGVSFVVVAVVGIILLIYSFAVIVPVLAMGVRRLHDTGKSGWYMLMSLIPYVGPIILIIFMATDSQSGTNQYGPNPKEQRIAI